MEDNIQNPYQSPEAGARKSGSPDFPRGTGDIDLNHSMSWAWRALSANMGWGFILPIIFFLVFIPVVLIPGVNIALIGAFSGGIFYAGIRFLDSLEQEGLQPQVGDLFAGFRNFLSITGAFWMNFLIMVVCLAPFYLFFFALYYVAEKQSGGEPSVLMLLGSLVVMLLFIPLLILMIFLSTRFAFAYHLSIDRGLGAVEAMKTSWRGTKGKVIKIYLLQLIGSAVMQFGALLCLVGMFPGLMYHIILFGTAYRQLFGEAAAEVNVGDVGENRISGALDGGSSPY